MFPTSVRNTALGFCSLFSRFGGVLAPLLTNSNLPGIYTIFGLTGVFSGLAGFFLPETKGKTLPESITEAEKSDNGYEYKPFKGNVFANVNCVFGGLGLVFGEMGIVIANVTCVIVGLYLVGILGNWEMYLPISHMYLGVCVWYLGELGNVFAKTYWVVAQPACAASAFAEPDKDFKLPTSQGHFWFFSKKDTASLLPPILFSWNNSINFQMSR